MQYPFSGSAKVRFADTDANGHAYFASYLILADEVASDYWAELGWDFSDVMSQPCLTFIANSSIDFVSECRANDWLDIDVRFSRLGTKSVTLMFTMTNRRSAAVAATGTMTSVFVSKESRTSTAIPEQFRTAVLSRQPELAAIGEAVEPS